MQRLGSVAGVSVSLALLVLAPSCKKDEAAAASGGAPASSGAAPAVTNASAATAAGAPASAAPLDGLDACLVGSWKSTQFSLKSPQVTAEGGASTSLQIAANGSAVVDFTGMAPVRGKGAGADFDFQYAGKASAVIATPARGTISSAKADVSALRVSANVALPGAGKFPVLKNKSVSELAQMASAITPGKAAAAAPPGVDSNPLFSTTHYVCEGDALTLSGDGPTWTFTRAAN